MNGKESYLYYVFIQLTVLNFTDILFLVLYIQILVVYKIMYIKKYYKKISITICKMDTTCYNKWRRDNRTWRVINRAYLFSTTQNNLNKMILMEIKVPNKETVKNIVLMIVKIEIIDTIHMISLQTEKGFTLIFQLNIADGTEDITSLDIIDIKGIPLLECQISKFHIEIDRDMKIF